jgi:hypothetical protein
MSIRAEEITEILKSQIKGYEKRIDVAETGVVLSVGDGIAASTASKRRWRGSSSISPATSAGWCSTSRRTTSAWSSSATTA